MTRVAIFGGAFDPPHMGHAAIVKSILEKELADEVWIVPSASHPLKHDMGSFQGRAWMCDLLKSDLDDPRIKVSRVEETLPAPNYTIQLLDHLQDMHPELTFRFIMGSDNAAMRDKWHKYDEVFEKYDPIVVPRSVEADGWSIPDVSSTEIRRLGMSGGDTTGMLTPSVQAFLYATDEDKE